MLSNKNHTFINLSILLSFRNGYIWKDLNILIVVGVYGKKTGFYERNIGKAVNLFTKESTISGDIEDYNRNGGIVVLKNSVQRLYNPDGSSQFVEFPGHFEIDVGIIYMRMESTREDRLGRIAKYNKELKKNGEDLEKKAKSNDP